MSKKTRIAGVDLINVHDRQDCIGRSCVIHNPSPHHMRGLDLLWDNDRGIFERRCPHGTLHPDPDQVIYWMATRTEDWEVAWLSRHPCDGCCDKNQFYRGEIES